MNISSEQKKLLLSLLDEGENEVTISNRISPFEVGRKYFIRTVTYHCVLEISAIIGGFLFYEKEKMSWVAYSGRFTQAIDEGKLDEVEPVKVSGGVSLDAIVDYFEWIHPLPRTQK